jgi:hypothetical protein
MITLLTGATWGCNYPFALKESEQHCNDEIDNDEDGLTDCADDDCTDDPACQTESDCSDEFDDDQDGLTDCADDDCTDDPACQTESDCSDEFDDDQDGLTDCDDDDCTDDPACQTESDCANGRDDDQDGKKDCSDEDCAATDFCTGPYPCNTDGECDPFEDRIWCADCCPGCIFEEGSHYDYIANQVIVPTNAAEAEQIGIDMNGDGVVDNKVGVLISHFFPYTTGGLNVELNEAIGEGDYIMLLRLFVSNWPADESMSVQIFSGSASIDATEDNLTGQGHTLISGQSNRTLYLCGDLIQGALSTCPGPIEVPFYLPGNPVTFPLEQARMVSTSTVSATGWEKLMVGGGMNRQTVENQLVPAMLVYMNQQTIEYPESNTANFVLTFLDAQCSSGIEGCADVVNEQGACAEWDGDPQTPPVTLTELLCNGLFMGYLEPDIDSDGDGEPELLSTGLQADAIPITIDN